jgi:hypothetical protein
MWECREAIAFEEDPEFRGKLLIDKANFSPLREFDCTDIFKMWPTRLQPTQMDYNSICLLICLLIYLMTSGDKIGDKMRTTPLPIG